MMNKQPPALMLTLLLAGCYQEPKPARPEDQLPPATQTGARTFGCLVNGQPFTPRGGDGLTGNYSLVVDPSWHGGNLSIRAYRSITGGFQSMHIGGDSIRGTGTYALTTEYTGMSFWDTSIQGACQNTVSKGNYHRGTLVITRYDLKAGIFSGTFDFKLAQPGCDTIKATHGRFDYKF